MGGHEADLANKLNQIAEIKPQEEALSRDVDRAVTERFGKVKWARCTYIMTLIFTLLTCLVNFYKADFINITVCTVAIYLLHHVDRV